MTEQLTSENRRTRTRFLPSNIYDALRLMKSSEFIGEMIGEENKEKFIDRKVAAADRCPRELGSLVKTSEILFTTRLRISICGAGFRLLGRDGWPQPSVMTNINAIGASEGGGP